jgi:hypothetical protein
MYADIKSKNTVCLIRKEYVSRGKNNEYDNDVILYHLGNRQKRTFLIGDHRYIRDKIYCPSSSFI